MPEQKKMLYDLIKRYPALSVCRDDIWAAYEMISDCYLCGGKLLVAGNGGSAADAEHIVGELMKEFKKDRYLDNEIRKKIMDIDPEFGNELCENLREALPAIALTGNAALSTACINDVDAAIGFAQQLYGYGKERDVFLGITTSGNSKNILNAMVTAHVKDMKTIILTGRDGGRALPLADIAIVVPENETYKIQELHLPIYHTLCLMLEECFFN